MKNHHDRWVRPRSTVKLRKSAEHVRGILVSLSRCVNQPELLVTSDGYVKLDMVLEYLPLVYRGFELEVLPRSEMGTAHGLAYPDERKICLREDVYEGLCEGKGRDRFTGAHELGHLFLHDKQPFTRVLGEDDGVYFSSEWQANIFGSALLMSCPQIHLCKDANDAMQRFGVSYRAADLGLQKWQGEAMKKPFDVGASKG